MKRNPLLFLAPVLLVFCSCGQNAGKPAAPVADSIRIELSRVTEINAGDKQRLANAASSLFDTILNNGSFNGGLLVAKGGNIVFEKYRSTAEDPVTAETPLHIASVTKTFTAMIILKMQEEGKLNVKDAFSKYFPRFNYPGLTIEHLLNHRSGIPNYLYFMEDGGWNKDSVITNQDVMDWLIDKKGLVKNIGTPGRGFSYSNTNYALLALLIEKLSGKTYPQYLRENIFEPLGMKNSFVHYRGNTQARSKSFDWKAREIPDNFLDAVYGDKNIYSTLRDLLQWTRALKPGVWLKAASLDSAFQPYSNEKPGIRNYGLGWRMNVYPGQKKMIYHNGWWHGNNSALILLPEHDGAIIALTNHFSRSTYKVKFLVNSFGFYFSNDLEENEAAGEKTDPLPETKSQAAFPKKK